MIVNPIFRANIAYLVSPASQPQGSALPKPIWTAFCVEVPIGKDGTDHYLVTAAHVLDEAILEYNSKLSVRLNTVTGRKDQPTDPDHWYRNDKSDVAVLPIWGSAGGSRCLLFKYDDPARPQGRTQAVDLDIPMIRTTVIAGSAFLKNSGLPTIHEGDDVFIPGLFSPHPGEIFNQPIVRFGRISLLPHEEVPLKRPAVNVKPYLIESRSWSGESGAPVFVYFNPIRSGEVWLPSPPPRRADFALLGLLHGHRDIPSPVLQQNLTFGTVNIGVASGISVVIAAQDILDAFEHPDLLARREAIHERWQSDGNTSTL